MASLIHRVDTKQIVMHIRMPRMFGLRMWMTIQIIKLAGIVSPWTIEIEA